MKKPELLAPAGSFEKAKIAFQYGADAVYAGTSNLSLRTRSAMQDQNLVDTIKYAHEIGKKVYTAINIYAWDENYEEIKKQAKILDELKVDGIIVADGGVVEMIKQYAPNIPIHISTQANTISYHSANFWYHNGARRVILGREMSKEQIQKLMERKPQDLEVEIFIHGALCFGYSGRCFLSDFLSGRSANLGDCVQSCRWAYNVYVEEANKPGNLMPVEYDEKGTYIFSSKDLCLIKEIPEIIEMGIDSLKIEGRLKTEYYLASVVNAYRNAIDDCMRDPKNYDPTLYIRELEKTKKYCLENLYDSETKTLKRSNKDSIVDISVLGAINPFRMLDPREKIVQNTIEKIDMTLRTYTGGYLRFERDTYIGGNNPWPIATLWKVLYDLQVGEIEKAKQSLEFITNTATKHGYLAEQVDNETQKAKWVIGLGWSHAMYIIVLYSLALRNGIKNLGPGPNMSFGDVDEGT